MEVENKSGQQTPRTTARRSRPSGSGNKPDWPPILEREIMKTPYRPPSVDLPVEFYKLKLKPCPMCGFSSPEIIVGTIDLQGYCPICQMQGPDRATENYAIHSWNSLPRRSEVMELLRLVHEVCDWDDSLLDKRCFPEDAEDMASDIRGLKAYADKLRKELGE